MRFSLHIDLDNAAARTRPAIARALRETAQTIRLNPDSVGGVVFGGGETVIGRWRLDNAQPDEEATS